MPGPITATGDLACPQQEGSRGAAYWAGRVEGVVLVRAVQTSIQGLGERGAAHHWRKHKHTNSSRI